MLSSNGKPRDHQLTEDSLLEGALDDGLVLCALVEVLTKRQLQRVNRAPKVRLQQIANVSLALNELKNDIRLPNIAQSGTTSKKNRFFLILPEDIMDHNKNSILTLLWQIILKFHVRAPIGGVVSVSGALATDSAKNAQRDFLTWIRSIGLDADNVTSSCVNF